MQHDDELFARCDSSEPVSVETHEVRYLDLSGAGVPDAVEHVTSRSSRSRGSDLLDTVEETRRLEYGIGVDGRPEGVTERTTLRTIDRRAHLHRELASASGL